MEATARHVVLFAVELAGDRPNGKTYIQKLCFFVSKLVGLRLGYRAHYYGPYSDEVSAELAFLAAAGMITETRRRVNMASSGGWEAVRFDYSLTEDGKRATTRLKMQLATESREIQQAIEKVFSAGEQNYIDLSFAAKTSWILESEGGPMTFEGIAGAAERFRWNVSGTDVRRAAAFLDKLGLVRLNPA